MDPFLRRLVMILTQETPPLTRNRHFHTFDNPEGRYALRISKRLLSIQKDLRQCLAKQGTVACDGESSDERVTLTIQWGRQERVCNLTHAEFGLLCELPDVQTTFAHFKVQVSHQTGA